MQTATIDRHPPPLHEASNTYAAGKRKHYGSNGRPSPMFDATLVKTAGGVAVAHMAGVPMFPPLAEVNTPNVCTEQAAYYLNRRPQTLREWACFESGPVRPLRICGRLAWPVDQIREVCGVAK